MKVRRDGKTKCELWDCGKVAITDCGNGVERIVLPQLCGLCQGRRESWPTDQAS